MTKVNSKFVVFSVLVTILLLSYTYAENISQHLEVGLKYVPVFIHLPLAILVPVLLLFITFIRKKLAVV